LRREGDLLRSQGDFAGAEEKYGEARRVAEEAYRTELAQKDKLAGNLAVAPTALAELVDGLRQGDRAVDYLQQALALRKRVVDAPQSGEILPADARAALEVTCFTLARAFRERKGDPAAARQHALRAATLLGEAAASGQTTPNLRERIRMNAGLASLEMGRVAFELGWVEEGKQAFEQSIARLQELVKSSPRNTTHLLNLEIASAVYGDILLIRLGQPAEARRFYQTAVRQSRARALSPEIARYQQRALALDHYRLGTAMARGDDKAGAARHFAACRAFREVQLREDDAFGKPGAVTTAKINLMLVQAGCGEHTAAAPMAALLLEAGSAQKPGAQQHRLLFLAAAGYALSAAAIDPAKRKEYLEKALHALQLAIANGYRNSVELETDPDLDPLRESVECRKAYQELVQQVRASKNP
jgi:tetratricopeptide (TPR) repeat protein